MVASTAVSRALYIAPRRPCHAAPTYCHCQSRCHCVSPADLDVLHNVHAKSGFRFVEQRGTQSYRAAFYCMVQPMPGDARVRYLRNTGSGTLGKLRPRTIIGSGYRTPIEAAKAVVNWFRGRHGDRWADVAMSVRVKPWQVVKRPRLGGWVARVWVGGRVVDVTLADVKPETRGGVSIRRAREVYVWPDRDTAYRMIREFLWTRFEQRGDDARLRIWRATGRKVRYAGSR